MIDNLTQAMTENEGEINELKESLYTQNRLINKQREEIQSLTESQENHLKENKAMQAQMVSQAEQYQETITNLRSRQAQ